MNEQKKQLIIVYRKQEAKFAYLAGNLISEYFDAYKVLLWDENEWNSNKSTVTTTHKIVFVGDNDLSRDHSTGIVWRYDEFNMKYGWLGNQCVIIANPVFDYGSGKYQDGVFLPAFSHYQLPRRVEGIVNQMRSDAELKQKMLTSWNRDDGLPLRRGGIEIISGPFGSGASVIADDSIVKALKLHQRDIIAIDMEAYGIAHSACKALVDEIPWLIVKGVQDYANSEKDDECRNFSAHMSAYFAFEFVKQYSDMYL